MSSPWNTIPVPETKDLQEIMSEELKKVRQKNSKSAITCPPVKWKYEMTDEELAKILHTDYNVISSEGDVCSSEDCGVPYNSDSKLEDAEDPSQKTYYDRFSAVLEKFDPIPLYNCKDRCNYKNRRIESTKKRKNGIFGVDDEAKIILGAMMEKQVFDEIHSRIPKKREGVVLHVRKNIKCPQFFVIEDYIVKIFKLLPYSERIQYGFVKGNCVPLHKTVGIPPTTKLIHEKAQKEALFLRRLRKAEIPCPKVITLRGHIIVLSMIGETKPALKLKDSQLNHFKNLIAYEQVMQYMKTMYQKCNLIHTNLSEENILWYKDCCYIISLCKALESHEEGAYKLLFDDCTRVCRYFTKVRVPKVISPDELFMDITGSSYLNGSAVEEFQESTRKKHL